MAIYLTLEDGSKVQMLQPQLKDHLYYADVGIEFGIQVVTGIEMDAFNEEFVSLYQWRFKRGDTSASGDRLDDVIKAEMIEAEDLLKKVLAKVDSGEYPFDRSNLRFRLHDAKSFLTCARKEYDGDTDYSTQIAAMPCPDDPETHELTFDLSYSAY